MITPLICANRTLSQQLTVGRHETDLDQASTPYEGYIFASALRKKTSKVLGFRRHASENISFVPTKDIF